MNKGDGTNPVYRTRVVGKEFNDKVIEGLFAAAPALEAFRLLLSLEATVEGKGTGSFTGVRSRAKRRGILIADVSRAFFEAPDKRGVCVELPEEALGEGESTSDVVGKFMAKLYGTRDASANWQVQPLHVL